MLTKQGGPEVLETVDLPLREPAAGEARVRVRACGVGGTDIVMRRGYYPFAPKIPFVQGYDVVGDVDAIGPGVAHVKVGDRVCALTVHGGYAEMLYRGADELVPVPAGLDDAEVVALILNYATAYQMIHRAAQQQPGEWALVTGANGGCGTALLELLRLHGVHAIGAASQRAKAYVEGYGATWIDGRGGPMDEATRAIRSGGVDVAYDTLGGKYSAECIRATRKGGKVIGYGVSGTNASTPAAIRGMLAIFVKARFVGRKGIWYGITKLYRKDRKPFLEDMPKLLALLAEKKLSPKIAVRLPLLDARRGNELQEAGGVDGKIVLVA